MIKRIALSMMMGAMLLANDGKQVTSEITQEMGLHNVKRDSIDACCEFHWRENSITRMEPFLEFDIRFYLYEVEFFSKKIDEFIVNNVDIPIGTIAHLANTSIALGKRVTSYVQIASAAILASGHSNDFDSIDISSLTSPFPDDNSIIFKLHEECPSHIKDSQPNEVCLFYCKPMFDYLTEIKPKLSKQIEATEDLLNKISSIKSTLNNSSK